MKQLLNVLLDPGKVFAELKDKPSFLLPFLLLIGANAALMLCYFNSVDPDWFTEYQLMQAGRDMTAAEIEQAKLFMPGARAMGYIAAVTAPLMMAVLMVIYALYYMLAGKLCGADVSFKHGFSLAAWASVPMVLASLVGIVGVVLMSPQTGLESLMLTRLDPLLVQLPFDHEWSGFAKGFDLLMFWSVSLAALGWRTWWRIGWGQSVVVALLPALLIYGLWALIAAL